MRRSCKRPDHRDLRRRLYKACWKPRRNYPVRKIVNMDWEKFKKMIRGWMEEQDG